VGVRTPYPVPRNALDPALVPGGSSSGSAVAVAQGVVSFALGTDTAGSGRVPAALNGIVGLKPTLGAVSTRGVLPACRTLDCVSVFAPSVGDAWRAFAAMAAYDPDDPYSRRLPVGRSALPARFAAAVPGTAAGRLAAEFGGLRDLAASVAEIDLGPFLAAAALLYDGPWVAERYAAIREFIESRPEALHPVTRKITEGARRFSAADAFAGQYRLAELRRATAAVWRTVDVLVVPSIPGPCTLAEIEADPIGANARLGTYTNFVNLLDLCALTVPDRGRAGGGVTLIAPAGRDGFLAALARALLAEEGPAGATATPPRDWVELAVVGAHLSGLPLNRQLTDLGATLLRAVPTTADYRFFALPGGPPARPGLVRVAPGAGGPVATEVWALPAEGFGRFVAAIPPPLGIGTVRPRRRDGGERGSSASPSTPKVQRT
jgi:allophanate hydrolase